MDINVHMERGIATILQTAARFYLKDKNGRRFITKFIPTMQASAKIRNGYEQAGVHIPPFLIASVASQCNLYCTGCYARAGGICDTTMAKMEMNTKDWNRIFCEAADLGISFILLAGGEPLLRREIVELASNFTNIIFPVFTNGTLIDAEYINLFDQRRNIIPVLSSEGNSKETDLRRGLGISTKIEKVMEELKQRNILFGTSITVTKNNLDTVISREYVSTLQQKGCGILFYVEYVPVEKGTENLVLSKNDAVMLDENIHKLKWDLKNMSLISFPGDEKYMGGCLAAGRGFFHINPLGNAEPCPFSPYSELNLKTTSIIEVLQSPFFEKIRLIGKHEAEDKQGGCTLLQHKWEVEKLIEVR